MKMTQGKLGLQVPVQTKNKSIEQKMAPDAMGKWRASLPMADTGQTAKKVYTSLTELNSTIIDPEVRFSVLELIRPPVQLVCQALRRHYINQTTELTKQKLTIAQLAQTLQMEMAVGYQVVIEDILGNSKTNDNILPTCFYRAMHYYTFVLLRSYQLYSLSPNGVWKSIHLLYQVALNNKLLKKTIDVDQKSKEDTELSVAGGYKHALLLAATNPYQWRQNEQELLNNALAIWSPLVEIQKFSKSDINKPSLYVVDPLEDKPPTPLALEKIEPHKECLVLNLKKVVARIKKITDEMKDNELKTRISHDGEPEFGIPFSVLCRIMRDWDIVLTRQHPRFPIKGKMEMIFGLSAAHYYLSGEKPFEAKNISALQSGASEVDDGLGSLPTFEVEEHNELTLESPKDDEGKANSGKQVKTYTCSLINVSPAGSCVSWEDETYPPIQSGEIVGLRSSEESEKNIWSVGVIRWLKHTKEKKLNIGVQLLAPSAKAGSVQMLRGKEPSGYYLRCLILPKMENLEREASIITPTLPFKEGKQVALLMDGEKESIHMSLTKQIDATGSFRQFEYQSEKSLSLDNAPKAAEVEEKAVATLESDNIVKTDKDGEDEAFGSIWEDL